MKGIGKHLEDQVESTSLEEGLDQGFNLTVVEWFLRNVEKYSSRGPKVVQGGASISARCGPGRVPGFP